MWLYSAFMVARKGEDGGVNGATGFLTLERKGIWVLLHRFRRNTTKTSFSPLSNSICVYYSNILLLLCYFLEEEPF